MLAPQAEAAFVAAGAKRWDGGPVQINLPARILNFTDPGDGDERQWAIHQEIVTHVGSLQGKLRRAEEREQEERRKEIGAQFGDLVDRQADDPYGFWEMTETQLVNWLGGNNAQIGSPVHEHGKQVLEQKRREADRRRGQAVEHRRRQERSGTTLEDRLRASVRDGEVATPINGKLFALLALIAALGTLIAVAVKGWAMWVVIGATVCLILTGLFVPSARRPVSLWLDRVFG